MKVCEGERVVAIGKPDTVYVVKNIGRDDVGKCQVVLQKPGSKGVIARRGRMLPDGKHASIKGFESLDTGIQRTFFD